MSLYDTVRVKCKCPACHTESVITFLTRSLEKKRQTLFPGCRISEFEIDYDYLSLQGFCINTPCVESSPDGYGTFLNARIRLSSGIVTNSVGDIEINNESPIQRLSIVKEQFLIELEYLEKIEEYNVEPTIQEYDGSYGDCHIPKGYVWDAGEINPEYEPSQKRIAEIQEALVSIDIQIKELSDYQ